MAKTAGLYESVTKRICAQLEQGVKPWERPWKVNGAQGVAMVPTNAATGYHYSGMNILLLWDTALERGYPTHGWMTYRQATTLGANVRKGEKAATVIYTKFKPVEAEGDEAKPARMIPLLKAYSVFNLAQLENLPVIFSCKEEGLPDEERMDALKRLADTSGVPVKYGGNRACYYPHRDEIHIPPYGSFTSDDAFCATLTHELVHATAHPDRLDRRLGRKFGDHEYAMEELVAELGAAFLCAHLGYQHERESAEYLGHWLTVLREDNRAIFRVASQASRAADWLREREHVVQGIDDPDEEARKASHAEELQEEVT